MACLNFRYIYTDEVSLTEEIVMSVLYAAKKYQISGLTTRCAKFLETQLNVTNATILLEHSIFFELKGLEEQCMNVIHQKTQQVFASEAFLHSSDEVIRRILESDALCVSEVQVFYACVSWAQMKCQTLGFAESPSALKAILGDLFYLIRFPTMTQREFDKHVVPMKLLESQEKFMLCMYFNGTCKDKPSVLTIQYCEKNYKP